MSWWNTSNFTSLASKALKNAQEKIDKALDISESEKNTESAEASGSDDSKKEKKSKGDFWSGWAIGDISSESSTSPKSSWQFPWGAGAEGSEEKEEIKEKTAEEIKEEVLKAAKERTKAKSKLFPQKTKTDLEETNSNAGDKDKDSESAYVKTLQDTKDDLLKSDQYKTSSGLDLSSENVDPSDRLSHTENVEPVVAKSDKDSFRSSSISGLIDSSKLTDDTAEIEKTEEHSPVGSQTCTDVVKSDESVLTDVYSEKNIPEFTEETVAKIDVSVTQTVTTSMSGSFLSMSVDDKGNKPQVVTSVDSLQDSSFHELTIDTENQYESFSNELQSLDRSSSGSDLLQIGDSKVDILSETSTDKEGANQSEENDLTLEESSSVERLKTDEENYDDVNGEKEKDLSSDVSSSVEIVLEKDIPPLEQESTEQSYALSEELLVKEGNDSHDSATSEEVSGASQSDAFSVIGTVKQETLEDYESKTNEQIQVDNLDISSKETDQQSSELQESGSAFVDLGQIEVTPRSESELSINTLDVSQDTCTSEETVIDEGLSASGTAENIKENLSKDLESVALDGTEKCDFQTDKKEQDRTSSNITDKVNEGLGDNEVEQSSEKNTEREKIDIVDLESQVISDKETQLQTVLKVDSDSAVNVVEEEASDGSDLGEKAELSPANSFVKCTLEDAMEESKGEDNSDSHSGTEKSDGSRSIHSGHESADEIDTTTSSDIEIISLPTPNGENRLVSPLDPVPLRIALQKTSWRGSPTHRRSDSSGSSANSKDGHTELSPGRDHLDIQEYNRGSYSEHRSQEHYDDNNGRLRQSELPALDEEDDNPYHPQRLLKKLAEMAEVLQAREDKLLQLSKENCDLVEANSILRNQLKQSEEAREAEMTDLNELTAEFTQRLTDAEKRISTVMKEKEQCKKQLQGAQSELAKKAADTSLQKILEEKEEQIQGLLEEGEKLSKSQLQSNTIIKKLRAKEKDSESTLASQKKKLESQKEELDHLKKVLDSKEEIEKKQAESLAQLQAAVNKQEIEMARLKSEHEDSHEKTRGLQAALDSSYKELAELHRSSAVQDSKAQEAALSAKMTVREELKLTIEKQQQQHKWEKDSLLMQIEDFRMSMARTEKECNRREDLLKQEIADLQKQLQEDEARTQELTQNVSSATRPLLRQIENLQSTYNAQSSTWEKVEKNLADRLADTQNQLAMSAEKERTANDQVLELGSKVTSLEAQNSRLRQEKSQLTAQLEMLKTKVELSEETKQNEAAQIEVLKNQLNQEITDLKKQKVLLETQLDMEKSKVEQEKKKVGLLQEQIRDLEREAARSRSRGTPSRDTPSPVSISRQESFTSSFHEQTFSAISQEELDRSFYLQTPNGNKQSLYEALRQSGAANLLENLQSQLKLREGEITHLQSEIHSLERTRESMAKELVNLSNSNDELLEQVQELPILREQYKELDQRYNALLQMYGEKVEETNELRLDLQDVKDMYKAQINHLLANQ